MLYINLGKDDVGRYASCIEELHKYGVGTCADVQTGDGVQWQYPYGGHRHPQPAYGVP